METSQRAIRLHTMFGHNHIELASRCLASMVKFYDQPIHVVVHEDGSVTEQDIVQFQRSVPDSSFVFKRDADVPVNEFLAKYPACRKLRDNLVYGLKIFDIQILESEPELSYADCDILFLRPLTRFFTLPDDTSAGGVFMKDPGQSYCLTPYQFMRNSKLHLADRLNGGLLHFKRSAFDWDLVEWFLGHDEYAIHPYWKEQTAWSVLAAASNSYAWEEKYCRVISSPSLLTPEMGVAHYVSSFRVFMKDIPAAGHSVNETPLFIPSIPFGKCHTVSFALENSVWRAKRIARRLGITKP